jgi:ribose 5-phosphate isomerase A
MSDKVSTKSEPDLQQDSLKKRAALRALDYVQSGMKLGLGSGSTVEYFVEALAGLVKTNSGEKGFSITCVPTSQQTAQLASSLGLSLSDLNDVAPLDLTVDGADEVELGTLDLTKGAGGALLREKIVAVSSKRMIVIVDQSKVVQKLNSKFPLPIEVVRFAWRTTVGRLESLGAKPHLRLKDGEPYLTDEGHYLVDCWFEPSVTIQNLAGELSNVVGVVETGLFARVASLVIVASAESVTVMEPDL